MVSAQRAEEAQTLFRNASQQFRNHRPRSKKECKNYVARAQAAEAAVFDAEIKSIDAKRAALKPKFNVFRYH